MKTYKQFSEDMKKNFQTFFSKPFSGMISSTPRFNISNFSEVDKLMNVIIYFSKNIYISLK